MTKNMIMDFKNLINECVIIFFFFFWCDWQNVNARDNTKSDYKNTIDFTI